MATMIQFDRQKFLQSLRDYKERKRKWRNQMDVVLAKEEEEIRRKREMLYAEYV